MTFLGHMMEEEEEMANLLEDSRDGVDEIRMTQADGGPASMEVVFKATDYGVQMSVWNPRTGKWHGGDLPVIEEAHSGADYECQHGVHFEETCYPCEVENVADGATLADEAAAPAEEFHEYLEGGIPLPLETQPYYEDLGELPETIEVKENEDLFEEITSIANHVRALRSIVQNGMEIEGKDLEEWNQMAHDLRDRLYRTHAKVISHILS